MTYQTGDVVRVTHDEAEILRTVQDPNLGLVLVAVRRMKDGSLREGSLFADAPGTSIELVRRARPDNWPPRQKDLWRDKSGDLWFAVDVSHPDVTDEPDIKFVPSYDADAYDAETISRSWGPLTLVHREDGAA